jgi:hypothetical protein
VKISIGPAIENGFYYDFDFPPGSPSPRRTSRRSRSGCASTSRPPSRSCARTCRSRGARALRRRGPGLQGRADRRPRAPDTRRSRPSRSTPTARSPTSAAARTRRAPRASRPSRCSRSPAPTGAATRRARCSRGSTAPPSSPRRSSRSISSARAGARARPPPARPRARPVPLLRALAGSGLLDARTGRRCGTRCVDLMPRDDGRARLHRGQDAAAVRRRAVEDLGHWDKYRDEHVRHRGRGAPARRSSR